MKIIRKINDELAIAGQITPEQLQQIAQEGFKSVLNLRSPDEEGFLIGEHQQAEALGLHYANIPIKLEAFNDEIATRVFRVMNESLPKPILVHCTSAKRAAALVLMYIAMRQGATFKQAFNQAEQLGLFAIPTYS
ncbi:MAG TPA: hypothetical protein DCY88_06335 [Cyanobacteria bacterium UBA11372]|nr:hypothetical protein [Cyanobacteria bacterium UBA11372]